MSTVFSCGHQASKGDEGVPISVGSYDRYGQKCVKHMVVCNNCFDVERQHGNLLIDDEDVLMWLED